MDPINLVINAKTEVTNISIRDPGYSSIAAVTRTSQLENDSKFITSASLPKKLSIDDAKDGLSDKEGLVTGRILKEVIGQPEGGSTTIKGTWTPQVTGEGYPLVNKFDLDSESSAELLVEGNKVTMVSGEAPSSMATNADVVFAEKSALYFKISSKDSVDGFMCSYIGFANSAAFDESITAFLSTGLFWSAESEGATIEGLGNLVVEDIYALDELIPMSQAEFMVKTWALCYDSSVGTYGELSIYDTETPNTPLASYQLQQDIGNPLCAVLVTPYAWYDESVASSSVEIIHEPTNPIAGFTTLKIGAEAVLSFDDVTANNAYVVVGESGASFGLHDGDIAFVDALGTGLAGVLHKDAGLQEGNTTIKGTWEPELLGAKFDPLSISPPDIATETSVTFDDGGMIKFQGAPFNLFAKPFEVTVKPQQLEDFYIAIHTDAPVALSGVPLWIHTNKIFIMNDSLFGSAPISWQADDELKITCSLSGTVSTLAVSVNGSSEIIATADASIAGADVSWMNNADISLSGSGTFELNSGGVIYPENFANNAFTVIGNNLAPLANDGDIVIGNAAGDGIQQVIRQQEEPDLSDYYTKNETDNTFLTGSDLTEYYTKNEADSNFAAKVKNNLTATVDPTTGDDSTSDYAPNSVWFNTATDEIFRCINSSNNSAVWVKTSLTLDELGTAATADVVSNTGNSAQNVMSQLAVTSAITSAPSIKGVWTPEYATPVFESGEHPAAVSPLFASIPSNYSLRLKMSGEYFPGDDLSFKVVANVSYLELVLSKGTYYESDKVRFHLDGTTATIYKQYTTLDSTSFAFSPGDTLEFNVTWADSEVSFRIRNISSSEYLVLNGTVEKEYATPTYAYLSGARENPYAPSSLQIVDAVLTYPANFANNFFVLGEDIHDVAHAGEVVVGNTTGNGIAAVVPLNLSTYLNDYGYVTKHSNETITGLWDFTEGANIAGVSIAGEGDYDFTIGRQLNGVGNHAKMTFTSKPVNDELCLLLHSSSLDKRILTRCGDEDYHAQVEVSDTSVAISTKNGSTPSSITVSPTALVISGVSNIIGITSDNLSEGTTNRYNKPRMPIELTGDTTINNADHHSDLFVVPNTQVTPIEIELLNPSTSDYFYFTIKNKSSQAVTFSDGSNPIVDAYGFGSVTQGGLVTVLWDGNEWMISGGLD